MKIIFLKKINSMKKKHLCNCGKLATWWYMPGYSGGGDPFHCDDCVPRGCTCNHKYLKEDYDNNPTEEEEPIKWIRENEVWTRVDEKGREQPCCEYSCDEDGYEIYSWFENLLFDIKWKFQKLKTKLWDKN